jgi:hypothetical protein
MITEAAPGDWSRRGKQKRKKPAATAKVYYLPGGPAARRYHPKPRRLGTSEGVTLGWICISQKGQFNT